jgi:hypothetical protein
MEPKDLKNSKDELSGAQVEPETVIDQVVEEVAESTSDLSEEQEVVEKVADELSEIENTADAEVPNCPLEHEEEPLSEELTEVDVPEELPVIVPETEIPEELIEEIPEPEVETLVEVDPEQVIEESTLLEPIEDVEVEMESVEEEIELPSDESTDHVDLDTPIEPVVAEQEPTVEDFSVEVQLEGQKEEEADLVELEEVISKPTVNDYSALTEIELVSELRNLLQGDDFEQIKYEVEAIKLNFFRRYRAKLDAQKAAFVEAGGDPAEYINDLDPTELELRNLLKQYQDVRNEHGKKSEETKEHNLQEKYRIIEEIKLLINNKESINRTFHEFRELQNQWREIGAVPQAKLKDLWETYHHHVENFYDFIKINKELRDLDLKKNLETKMEICEKAEELLVEPSVLKAFNNLQKYHEQWREVGPVPRDKKDELWERFKAVTSIINKKHQDFYEGKKSDQKKNLDAKIALCEKVEEIANAEFDVHRDWDEKSKELVELQKVWRTIGFAPKKENNKVYERFRSASDKFFDRKREFYNQNKEEQQNNLQMKIDLCVQAENLKDSTDWKKTADEFIAIQKAWKEIGPVPRKFSDTVWKRFRVACDFFFENKSKHFSSLDGEQVTNLKLKKELLEEVRQFKLTGNDSADLDKLKEFQRRFTEIGFVPFKEKNALQSEFRELINHLFDSLRIDEKKRNLMNFKNKVAGNTVSGRGQSKNRFERDKYMTKLKQMETDLALLDNNIGFFANTKNAEALIGDVNQKIADTKEKIEFLKEKIRIMDEMDDDE